MLGIARQRPLQPLRFPQKTKFVPQSDYPMDEEDRKTYTLNRRDDEMKAVRGLLMLQAQACMGIDTWCASSQIGNAKRERRGREETEIPRE